MAGADSVLLDMEELTARSPSSAPALLPAAGLLAGLRLGLAVPHLAHGLPWGPLLALALLGVALGRRPGTLLAICAVGAVAGALAAGQGEPPSAGWLPDPERPVVALAEVTGHWRRFEDSWSAPVRIVGLRQGSGASRRVRTRPLDAWLRVGGDEEPPGPGSRLRVRGHLRRAPALGNVPATPPGPWRLSCKSRRLLEVVAHPGPVDALSGALRRRVERALEEAWRLRSDGRGDRAEETGAAEDGGAGLALARALVLGDASGVSLPVRRGLRRLGLAHVLAVSGLHVALVAGVAALAGAWLGRFGRLSFALGAMAAYLLVVGPRASLLRASVMGCLAVASLIAERPPQTANALAVAAGALALRRPALVLDLGFRLTVGATAGIVLLEPVLARAWAGAGEAGGGDGLRARDPDGPPWIPRALDRLRRSLAASVGAQIGVMPWAVPAFVLLTPWAPVANLVAVPWTALALLVCLLWAGLACVSPGAAAACLAPVDLVATPFSWPAALPPRTWLALPVSLGPAGAMALAAAVFLLFRCLRRPRMAVLAAGGLAVALLGTAGSAVPEAANRPVSAAVLDVGQGDAILLRDGGSAVLVDGGGWRHGDLGGRVLLPTLARLGVRRLDRVIASHPDRDHCGGLVDVAGYLEVGEAVTGPGVGESPCGRALAGLPGVRSRSISAGDELRVGRWRLRVLHPAPETRRSGENDDSLVIVAEAFGRRLLLTGDVEVRGEASLLRRGGEGLACDLLKVAHHGSRSSSGRRFLDRARPLVALVSAGIRNPYGHPAPEVLERLRRRGVRTFRTDRDGMVVVEVGPGGSMRIELPGAPKAGARPALWSSG